MSKELKKAMDVLSEEESKAHKGYAPSVKKTFEAVNTVNAHRVEEIYSRLSKEFIRLGMDSQSFSELEELKRIASMGAIDYNHFKWLESLYGWAKANVPEMECRMDEDCDHCLATSIMMKIEDAKNNYNAER